LWWSTGYEVEIIRGGEEMKIDERIREFLVSNHINPDTEKGNCCGCDFEGIKDNLKKLLEEEEEAT